LIEARTELTGTLEIRSAGDEVAGRDAMPELAEARPEDTPLAIRARDDSCVEEAALLPTGTDDDIANGVVVPMLDRGMETSIDELIPTEAADDTVDEITARELDTGPKELAPAATDDGTTEDKRILMLEVETEISAEELARAEENDAPAELDIGATETKVGTEEDPTSTIELTIIGPVVAADACLELDAALEGEPEDGPTTTMELTISGPLMTAELADTGRELDMAIKYDPDDMPPGEFALGDALPPAEVVTPAEDGMIAAEENPGIVGAADEDRVVTLIPASNRAPL